MQKLPALEIRLPTIEKLSWPTRSQASLARAVIPGLERAYGATHTWNWAMSRIRREPSSFEEY